METNDGRPTARANGKLDFSKERERRSQIVRRLGQIERRIDANFAKTNRDHEKSLKLNSPLYEERRELESELLSIKAFTIKPGQTVSLCPYSDWRSYTILSRTRYTLTCQADAQTHFKDCRQDGELHSKRDKKGKIITLHWSKKNNWWHYGCYTIALGRRNYRDPTF